MQLPIQQKQHLLRDPASFPQPLLFLFVQLVTLCKQFPFSSTAPRQLLVRRVPAGHWAKLERWPCREGPPHTQLHLDPFLTCGPPPPTSVHQLVLHACPAHRPQVEFRCLSLPPSRKMPAPKYAQPANKHIMAGEDGNFGVAVLMCTKTSRLSSTRSSWVQ